MEKYEVIFDYLKNHDVEEITDNCQHELSEDITKFYRVLDKAGFASDIVGHGDEIDPMLESIASSLYIVNTRGFMEDFNEGGNDHFTEEAITNAIDDEFDPYGGQARRYKNH